MVGKYVGGMWWLGCGKLCCIPSTSPYAGFSLVPLFSHPLLLFPAPLPGNIHRNNSNGELS